MDPANDPPAPHAEPAADDAAEQALDLFARISDRAAEVVRANEDWTWSGRRPTQYAVDLLVDEVCVGPLLEAGYSVLSEESGLQHPGDAPSVLGTVVVDPLDGSTNASLGLPYFNTALCLVVDGVPTAAMVTNLVTGERSHATRGGGAFRDGRPIAVAPPVALADSILALNGWPPRHWGWRQYRAMGAAALEICAVARGAFDGFADVTDGTLAVWDYLAAGLIVEEAGGVAADAFGRELVVLDHAARRAPVYASHPDLLDRLAAERRADP